ncbi:flagellar hook assembly protein FlgD [Romboutsia sp.]|uniref:flagellar hook assembly protein FlgD n=1 Tax=Romboutsia sp. TaxID=1965302 RepID=UPI002BD3E11A|nr:flagellar hook capping FlgD N-terminal domain-containing protein [Romboutsia sp.]HSQ87851.1 flagellar hook capping FlgD N-terminal domain-containing protein [Romboutsia sp.]
MNNLSSFSNGVKTSNTRTYDKTENGTPIVKPGQENDKDLFLKMLVSQMSNQDPFNPQDPTQYVTQLAQFNSLEQMMNLNDGMEYLLGMTNSLLVNSAMSSASSLIGKQVEVYASVKNQDGEEPTQGDDINKETLTGVVEGIHIKDGIVYMDIRINETGELKSIEYGSLIKISENNTNSDINIGNKGE